jgi:hypothetical protein
MRKIYYVLALMLVPGLLLFQAFTTGPGAGNAGSPLDGQSCTNCHTGQDATTVDNWITTDIPSVGYTPGETYTITVSAPDIEPTKIGFQITSETETVKTGTWIITDETRTQLASTTAVTHTAAGTAPSGDPNSWSMNWTAPAEGTGDVMFYAAVNNTNNDGSNAGDKVYLTSHTEKEATVGIAELFDQSISNVYPNPAAQHINLQLPADAEVKVYDNSGREVMSVPSTSELLQLNVSNLDNGIYYLRIQQDGQMATRSFIKR